MNIKQYQSDVIIAGGGLAGIVTAYELLDQGKSVTILERDTKEKIGGLAIKSFGGIMMTGTPEQKKMGIRDTPELALADWHSFAQFSNQDVLPQQWAKLYTDRSLDIIYHWLRDKGVEFLPVVNWPERGAIRHGNSVPRWHITWGTGYHLVNNIIQSLNNHNNKHKLNFLFNHRVENLIKKNKIITGVKGKIENSNIAFSARAEAVVIASGGICGGDLSMVKKNWYKPWGKPPKRLLNGSHRFADGLLHKETKKNGGVLTHLDKQWHYAAGVHDPDPEMPQAGLSLVPPRSALWMDSGGKRFGPMPLMGYTDTRYVVEQICKSKGQYSWQILNWKIALKELAVSGSAYMTAFRNKSRFGVLKSVLFGNKALVNRLLEESIDFVVADNLDELINKMNALETEDKIDRERMKADIKAYDDHIKRGKAFYNDDQLRRIANFRTYKGDRLRTCNFQKIDDPKNRPLIAIREFILSRKSLGGIQTDLQSRVLNNQGKPIGGLYAVGEAAGFGGGGIHGMGSLEGTFLGSCILTGRIAGRSICGKTF